MTQQEAGT